MKLVKIKIPERAKRTIAVVPDKKLPKYKPIISRATAILIALSIDPIFCFMSIILK